MSNYLNDNEFLLKVFNHRQRNVKVKIIALTFGEEFIDSIEGKVISGNITVDGKSALRRTCNLTLIPDEDIINNSVWGLNTKFSLEIGIKNPFYNNADSVYPETLWFPQGVYLITGFSISINSNTKNISITGKDKMSLLNGDISGHLNQATVLDVYYNEENKKEKYPIVNIIYDMLYLFGNEKSHNIIIKDLEKLGVEMSRYIGTIPIYLKQGIDIENKVPIIGPDAYTLADVCPEFEAICEDWTPENGDNNEFVNDIPDNFIFSSFSDDLNLENQTVFRDSQNNYFLLYQIKHGDMLGYQATPLVYPSDLIVQPGETITSVLDKITQMFGNSYEYFYNIQGQFIFQKKKTYIDTSWQPFSFYIDGSEVEVKYEDNEFVHSFYDTSMITNYNINPSTNNIKNDYIVYGENSLGLPLHLRYAIDEKPQQYTTIREKHKKTYVTSLNYSSQSSSDSDPSTKIFKPLSPGSQLIYKSKKGVYFSMSSNNFSKKNSLEKNTLLLIDDKYFLIIDIQKTNLGRYRIFLDKSADQYLSRKMYSDIKYSIESISTSNNNLNITSNATEKIVVDWRELIYQMALDFDVCGQEDGYAYKLRMANPTMLNGKTGYEQYYTDIQGFWPEVYRYIEADDNEEKIGWNLEKINDPNSLSYWLEFIEGSNDLMSLSIKNIGDRTQIKNDKDVKCLFDIPVPEILLYTEGYELETLSNYSPCRLNDTLKDAIDIAPYSKSAKSVVDTEFSTGTFFAKTLGITIIPMYHLDVNRKIYIEDSKNNIKGQFLINSFTIPLNYDGTMSISTSEIIEPLY